MKYNYNYSVLITLRETLYRTVFVNPHCLMTEQIGTYKFHS